MVDLGKVSSFSPGLHLDRQPSGNLKTIDIRVMRPETK